MTSLIETYLTHIQEEIIIETALNQNFIKQCVYKAIADYLDINPKTIKDNMRLDQDLEMDDLDRIEVIMALEELLNLSKAFPDKTEEQWKTVSDIIKSANKAIKDQNITQELYDKREEESKHGSWLGKDWDRVLKLKKLKR
jgi:acyl carrier protein